MQEFFSLNFSLGEHLFCTSPIPPKGQGFTVQFGIPHARGEKSSALNGQAATNQTPNPSQYVLFSFHLISGAIWPLQLTPSGSLFSKIQDKTTPKGRVYFHHDTRPLKTRLLTLPPLINSASLGYLPSPCTAFSRSLSANSFR